jgi:hypothetical protein
MAKQKKPDTDAPAKDDQLKEAFEASQTELNEALLDVAEARQDAAEVSEKYEAQMDELATLRETVSRLSDAINNPVVINKALESGAMDQGEAGDLSFQRQQEDPDADQVIQVAGVSAIESPEGKAKMDLLKFMREPCRVRIETTSEKQADPRFMVSVNGRSKVFERGKEYVVPRYYIEGLARAKPVTYGNEEFEHSDGTKDVRYPASVGLRYNFAVIEDPSGPEGQRWLSRILKEG